MPPAQSWRPASRLHTIRLPLWGTMGLLALAYILSAQIGPPGAALACVGLATIAIGATT